MTALLLTGGDSRLAVTPRGPVTELLVDRLSRPPHQISSLPPLGDGPLDGEDSALALYDTHVEADERHQVVVALDDMVAGLLETEPGQAANVLFGARALQRVEARFAGHLLSRWAAGRSSLRSEAPPPLAA